jgi:osmotically-inducible protein OsmY
MTSTSTTGELTFAEDLLQSLRSAPTCILTLIVSVVVLWSTTSAASPARDEKSLTDGDIVTAVESQLWTDKATDANRIDVNVVEGIVTLTGEADNILEKERAEKICEVTVGVRAVVNRIEINPLATRTDVELRDAIKQALFQDPATESYEVTVDVTGGVVTLTGLVDSWQERELCATVAKGVRGVLDLENEIDVISEMERSDYELKHEVEARLANDVRVDDYLIEVDVKDGNVSLTGTVGSLQEKSLTRMDSWVAGVKSVDVSGLEIKWWARNKMRREAFFTSRGDEEIAEAVKDAFLYDPRVYSFEVDVSVEDGVVTLAGTVDNLAAKNAAVEDARNVVGVWQVKNHLKVRPETTPPDDELAQHVAEALADDPYVERFAITIEAHRGWIYLTGDVDNSFQKERAEEVAGGVKGVSQVANYLDFAHEWERKPDWEISSDLAYELFWSPFVDEGKVNIAVEDGVVTLTGTVDNWSEFNAAENNAYEAGAKRVNNRLVVRNRYYGPRGWLSPKW